MLYEYGIDHHIVKQRAESKQTTYHQRQRYRPKQKAKADNNAVEKYHCDVPAELGGTEYNAVPYKLLKRKVERYHHGKDIQIRTHKQIYKVYQKDQRDCLHRRRTTAVPPK